MLSIYSGNQLHDLGRHYLHNCSKKAVHKLLQPQLFVVQNHGMGQWLSLFIAEKEGIAANLTFNFPAEIFWKLARAMDPHIPETLPSEKGPMSWALMDILQNDKHPSLEVLHRYINRSSRAEQAMRRWQLASRIAGVFDEYLTFRPDLLLQWEGEDEALVYNDETERWQSYLWQQLNSRWQKQGHRAHLQKKLMKALDEGTLPRARLPEQISVFGVSSIPPVYLKMIVKLSRRLDVNFYTRTKAKAPEHPLFRSFGRNEREFRALLDQYIADEKLRDVRSVSTDSGNDSVFNSCTQFQAGLMGLQTDRQPGPVDHSIQVHSCHSSRREVEVLRDQLLAIMDEDAAIDPSDILVLAPDMASYRAAVESVFGAPEQHLPAVPYHFSEGEPRHLISEGFISLMELADSRFTVTEVLDLLHHPAVRKQFSFSTEDLNTLKRWIEANNIRWGIDKNQKAALDLPASSRFTWQSGLNRIMLGYAMSRQDDALYEGIIPFREVEQSENIRLAAQCSHFLHLLFQCNRQTKAPKEPGEWSTALRQWVDHFFSGQEEYFAQVQRLRDGLMVLQEQSALAGADERVPFSIIRAWLIDHLQNSSAGGSRSGRGITFSSMISMRNIPAKVICMLGLNDGEFPRSDEPVSFDLVARYPQVGDRSHGRDDRQLFLQTLLSARKRLYFSYVGQSDRQDTELPPSVVLREWMDYVMQRFGITENELLTRHRLQAFSPHYFIEDTRGLFSYSAKNKEIARELLSPQVDESLFINEPLSEADASFRQLTVEQLRHFFSHPARFFLQNRLGIYFHRRQILSEDRESFTMDKLGEYKLGQQLLERYFKDESLAAFKKVAFARDALPEGWPGEQTFEKMADEARAFGVRLMDYIDQQKMEPLQVDIALGDFRLTGRLGDLYSSDQILFRYGRARAKDFIQLWINHLILQLLKPAGQSGRSLLLTTDDKQRMDVHRLQPFCKPENELIKLLQLYWKGLGENIFFFPKSSFAYATAILKEEKDAAKALDSARLTWKNEHISYDMEGDDIYNKCLMNGINPMEDNELKNNFKQISMQVWEPFFNVYETE